MARASAEATTLGRFDDKAIGVSWPTLMRDLKIFRAVDLQRADNRHRIQTDPGPAALAAFRAAEVRPPASNPPNPRRA